MKRLLLVLVCLLLAGALYGQTSSFFNSISDHYKVTSDVSEEYAVQVAKKMEAALVLFNNTLHFNLADIDTKFKVTIFYSKEDFDNYLQRTLDTTRDSFVYVHYTDLNRCELVGFKIEDEDDFNSTLLHQGFIQFIKAYIPNPPIWIREGMATYLENSYYDLESDRFIFRPNYIWLDSLKNILRSENEDMQPIPLASLLSQDRESVKEQFDTFYPQAWGLIDFLTNSKNKEYNRIIWDSLSALNPEKTLKDNSIAVMKEAFSWYDESYLINKFTTYILSLQTFNDLITQGVNQYAMEEMDKSINTFSLALSVEPQSYVPYYYLGLISYTKREYVQAEDYYKRALALGSEPSLTSYALGVNAFADNRYESALEYLSVAKAENPESYSEKVDSLIQRIDTLR